MTQTVWIICRVASQCLTYMIVFVLLQICLRYLMDASASCYKNDGRVVWWLALCLSLLPSGMSDRCAGVGYASSHSLNCRDLVLVSLQCPWLVRCCPTRSNEQRRQDPILPPLPTPGVTIYKSDGACRGQSTNAETHASWSAAVWSADDRGLGAGVAFATARGFLGKDYSNNQAEYIAPLQCLCRALRLQDPHVIFEVDSLLLAKQLARHLPWACRSENLIALHQQCVHVCDSLSALHISWIFGIFIVSSNRAQTHCLIKRLMSVIRVVLRLFGNAQTAHPAYLFFSLLHPFCYSRVSDLV